MLSIKIQIDEASLKCFKQHIFTMALCGKQTILTATLQRILQVCEQGKPEVNICLNGGRTMKVRKRDVGRQCRVRYDDIGQVDAILLEKVGFNGQGQWDVFIFATDTVDVVDGSQIVELGKRIKPQP